MIAVTFVFFQFGNFLRMKHRTAVSVNMARIKFLKKVSWKGSQMDKNKKNAGGLHTFLH